MFFENILEAKRKFALELLKTPTNAFMAAKAVFPENSGQALYVSTLWVTDADVLRFQEEAREDLGDGHFLPKKADLAREAWLLATTNTIAVDDRLKAMRLYADIQGYIEKQGTVVNNNILTNNKVMVVKSYETDEEWANKLSEQQTKLITDADVTRQ